MITKEQFKAHVRAEAQERYPKPSAIMLDGTEVNHWRTAYIAARMEHEWPLASALYAIMEAHGPGTLASEAIYVNAVLALAPYTTTKPTEQR